MKKSLVILLLMFVMSCFAYVGLKVVLASDEQGKKVLDDVARSILTLVPENVRVVLETNQVKLTANEHIEVQEEFTLNFSITYDATKNSYYASWMESSNVVYSCSYSPKEERPYRDFVRECAHYPLEKVALRLLMKNAFGKYLRITYHPSVDEYSSFSPDGKYFAFITDRLGGNRNIALLDLQQGSLRVLPVHGSSEYFPRFSPDGTRLAFQGSLHGFWNIYIMPIEDYAKNIVLISAGNAPAYSPAWFDANTLLYVQDTETGNAMYRATLARRRSKLNIEGFDMVFSPAAYGQTIYFVGLREANFGIYALTPEGNVVCIEDGFYNEHDPAISPDGRYLAYSCNCLGYYAIWVKDLETGEKWCLTEELKQDAFYPSFSPDGQLVGFSASEGFFEPDIWFVRFFKPSDSQAQSSLP
ncbi:hypothetical protein AS159_09945 [Thermotoga sp. Ku-13t]|uniref:PD40 domain-containing protein n=1 Tax=Thermotoga sp. Ku-13t TaxID=1755813 RepID=UPI0013EC61B6|nr:PD40 domain-containing protein [Thermotoga sp. Ku-13t]KAF2957379.1 hypothetical protein AS159_09945 [Thermotoga sp. Ku-13t]